MSRQVKCMDCGWLGDEYDAPDHVCDEAEEYKEECDCPVGKGHFPKDCHMDNCNIKVKK